jgi:hypothetical protein
MDEHRFGAGTGQVKARVCNQIARIAQKHDASFYWNKSDYWFTCRARGVPLDTQTESAVWADMEAAGLADAKGLVASCFTKRSPVGAGSR